MTDAAQLSTLALDVWRFGMADRGEHLFAVVRRLERELGTMCDPQAVSAACRELYPSALLSAYPARTRFHP